MQLSCTALETHPVLGPDHVIVDPQHKVASIGILGGDREDDLRAPAVLLFRDARERNSLGPRPWATSMSERAPLAVFRDPKDR